MPFMPVKKQGYVSIRQASRMLGLHLSNLWRYIHEDGLLPEPASKVGNRYYYSPCEFTALSKAVSQLRAKGRIS